MYANLLTQLIGSRIIGTRNVDAGGIIMPVMVVLLPDGTKADVYLQSDPEGNDAGFPAVVRQS